MGGSNQDPDKEGREDETGIMAVLPCELVLYILLCVDSHQTVTIISPSPASSVLGKGCFFVSPSLCLIAVEEP
jgi:hypothetical protein